MDEEELERLAAEELLREAQQGAARAIVHGALGWKKDNAPRPNKRFLTTTLANTMQYNYRRSRSRSESPHHRHKHRSRRESYGQETSNKDKHYHRLREEEHRSERERRRDRSVKSEKSDKGQMRKSHKKDHRREHKKKSKSGRSHSHS